MGRMRSAKWSTEGYMPKELIYLGEPHPQNCLYKCYIPWKCSRPGTAESDSGDEGVPINKEISPVFDAESIKYVIQVHSNDMCRNWVHAVNMKILEWAGKTFCRLICKMPFERFPYDQLRPNLNSVLVPLQQELKKSQEINKISNYYQENQRYMFY